MRRARVALLLATFSWLTVSPPASAQLLGNLVVNLTSPAAGSTVSGTVPLSASVTIVGLLTVQGVQFYVDGVPFGAEDRSAPYSIPWNTTTAINGPHTVKAVARDLLGLQFSSSTITVTVSNDATPPTVSVTSPASGSAVSGTITVSATASDNVGVSGVQFTLDGANLGFEDTTAPYAASWNTATAASGAHTLRAVARDAAGNRTTSAAVTVTVNNDTAAPTVSVTSPAAASTVSGTIAVTASASDDIGVVGVQFRLDGVNLGVEDTAAPHSTSWNTATASNGAHTLTAVARDASGKTTTAEPITVTVANDGAAPSVTINQAATQADPTSSSPIMFTAVFSEAVSGFTGSDVAIGGTADGTKTVTVSGGPSTYTVAVSGMTTGGTVVATIAAGAAADGAGNGNTAATSTDNTVTFNEAAPAALTWTRIEETELSITYTAGSGTDGTGASAVPPAWFHGSTSRAWSLGTASFNRSVGARATFTFTGTSIRWISLRAPWAGIARVSVDGEPATEVDLYLGAGRSPEAAPCSAQQVGGPCVDEEVQAVVYSRTGLPSGTHTFTIEVTGLRNSLAPAGCSATDCNAVVVDALDVAPSSSAPPSRAGRRFEETSIPPESFTGAWTQGDRARAWSGGTGAASAAAGARARFTFTGTEVRWLGLRGPGTGIARVLLDGALHATVDTFSPTEVQATVFAATDLADGRHTLEIEVTGSGSNPDPATRGAAIVVDAFDVRSRFEDRDRSITYTGSWVQQNMDRAWSGTSPPRRLGTAAITVTPGAVAEFRFSGSAVSWIGMRGPQAGIARVTVDGGAVVADVNLFAASEQVQTVVFTAPDLPDGSHTLRIEKIDTGGSWIVVDAFDSTPSSAAPPVARSQETSATYTGAWTSEAISFWSGGTGRVSATPGAEATFTFTGTSVRWIGHRRSDFGMAQVFVDGVLRQVVDTFAPFEEFQVAVFSVTGLEPGVPHTLTIRVAGSTTGGGTLIVVDAFEVY